MATIASPAWGNTEREITQGFQVGFRADWYQYSKDFGYPPGWHIAYDIAMPQGTPLYALNPGIVEHAGWSDSFRPNPVYVVTEDNPATPGDESGHKEIYGHMWSNSVKIGQRVEAGDLLGYSGQQTTRGTMSPDGSGPHLHFELLKRDSALASGWRAMNPDSWLREGGDPDAQPGPTAPGDITALPTTGAGPLGELAGLASLGGTLANVTRRGVIIVLGLGLLMVGVNALLAAHTGTNIRRSVKRTVRKVSRTVPAGRVARVADPDGFKKEAQRLRDSARWNREARNAA